MWSHLHIKKLEVVRLLVPLVQVVVRTRSRRLTRPLLEPSDRAEHLRVLDLLGGGRSGLIQEAVLGASVRPWPNVYRSYL